MLKGRSVSPSSALGRSLRTFTDLPQRARSSVSTASSCWRPRSGTAWHFIAPPRSCTATARSFWRALEIYSTPFGDPFQHTSKDLRGDREIVLKAVGSFAVALNYTSKELRFDRAFMFEAVAESSGGEAMGYVPEEFLADRDFVLEAVGRNGDVLDYVSEEHRTDREMVLDE